MKTPMDLEIIEDTVYMVKGPPEKRNTSRIIILSMTGSPPGAWPKMSLRQSL